MANTANFGNALMFEAHSDSMSPIIKRGDRVIVDASAECQTGDIAVVNVNSLHGLIVRIASLTENSITLTCENKKYCRRPVAFDRQNVEIIGAVNRVQKILK